MRRGHNPNKQFAPAAQITPIVMTCITHLPVLEGYHAERMEVVRTCLESMRKHAGGKYTTIVWDNGSCAELLDWLRNEYKPDILIQSANIGKNSATQALAGMLPPETIMTYCDDDMFFYPDWLAPQVALLKSLPNVACVSGYPVRTSFRWGNENTVNWFRKYGRMTAGKFLPSKWEEDFAISIGRDPNTHKAMTLNDVDLLGEFNGRTAYLTSHHCQFVAYAGVIAKANKADSFAMGEQRFFDIALDQIGLRLATTQRLSRHIGNIIHDELRAEIMEANK
jgi:hypothetical protein